MTTSTADLDVLVVGAGPTGLLAALELALVGVRVLVVDRLDAADTTIKAGSINVATAEILQRRGLFDAACEAQRTALADVASFLRQSGSKNTVRAKDTAGSKDAGAHPAFNPAQPQPRSFPAVGHFAGMMFNSELVDQSDPGLKAHLRAGAALMVPQHAVERILLEAVEKLGVEVRRGVEVHSLSQDGESVHVQTSAGDIRPKWLIAADGGRSAVRKALDVPFPGTDAEITGYQAIAELEGTDGLQRGWTWTPTGVYSYGPIPGRILTVQFTGPPADRNAPVTAAELQDSIRLVSGVPVTVTGLHGMATRWTDNTRQAARYRVGRVFLAGDAAHVHPPFSGQGLNLGAGDASNLGWKLAAVINGCAPESLLDTYESERHPIGAWVLDWTRAQVALMRGDAKTTQLRFVTAGLLDTISGMTRIVAMNSGIAQQYALQPGQAAGVGYDRTGPVDVGRLVGDIQFDDGRTLSDYFHDGRFVLIDGTAGHRLGALCEPWASWLRVVPSAAGTSALVRPDGVVAWTETEHIPTELTALPASLGHALRRWAGPAA